MRALKRILGGWFAGLAFQACAAANISEADAARFLTQATFGPTPNDIAHVQRIGYEAWIDEQLKLPLPALSHQAYWDSRHRAIIARNPGSRAGPGEVVHSFWAHALAGPDQLRQRMAFALSEIFVISWADNCIDNAARGAASYLDLLGKHAFGAYRDAIEAITLHPAMGCYLSHLKNQKEDESTGRMPDENYARELMQLFSIGLYEMNMNGSIKLDAKGQPIETYSASDVSGLAKVMTGWSWDCQTWPSNQCFVNGDSTTDGASTAMQYVRSMKPYQQFHSTTEKRFLGVVIPAQPIWPNPESNLKQALDTIAAHPNVAPFLSKQLIQRFVTSNPSSAYVERIALVYLRSQGNFGQTLKAILLDEEARSPTVINSETFGKVREPILRLSAVMRAIGVQSRTGRYLLPVTDDPGRSLGQAPLKAPSVFNFFRPGYVPPNTETARARLVAPEMQLMHETSVAGYVNFIRDILFAGIGAHGFENTETTSDVHFSFNLDENDPWLRLADQPGSLVARLNRLLTYDTLPSHVTSRITSALSSIDYKTSAPPSYQQVRDTRLTRLRSAILMVASSPTFLVQR